MDRTLNANQQKNLKTVLRFRYVTTVNLADYLAITTNSAYSALEILYKSGYLGKLHEKSYRLLNKSARYFLTDKGLLFLRKTAAVKYDDSIWKSQKNGGKKTSDFIDLHVAIHTAYNDVREHFGNSVDIDTGLELHGTKGSILPLPGLLVTPRKGKRFFVEVADGQHLFFIRKRIRKYIQNYELNEWEWDKYPDVYFIRRRSASDRARLRKFITQLMEDSYLDETDFTFHVVASISQIKLA